MKPDRFIFYWIQYESLYNLVTSHKIHTLGVKIQKYPIIKIGIGSQHITGSSEPISREIESKCNKNSLQEEKYAILSSETLFPSADFVTTTPNIQSKLTTCLLHVSHHAYHIYSTRLWLHYSQKKFWVPVAVL